MNKRDEAVLDFREKFPVHLKAGDGRMLWVRRDEVESWLLQKLQEERERVVKEIEKSLPEEIGESEGWDLAFESCCGGDDTAHGWNHCRKVVLKKLSIIKSK